MIFGGHKQKHLKMIHHALTLAVYPLHVIASSPLTASNWISETFTTKERLLKENRQLEYDNP